MYAVAVLQVALCSRKQKINTAQVSQTQHQPCLIEGKMDLWPYFSVSLSGPSVSTKLQLLLLLCLQFTIHAPYHLHQ
jgi:hypothetical protein